MKTYIYEVVECGRRFPQIHGVVSDDSTLEELVKLKHGLCVDLGHHYEVSPYMIQISQLSIGELLVAQSEPYTGSVR